ncbi:CTP synthase [Deinococcus deserti]|uniref:CTP synthase n=1 Tax=Deinococcus deserti (strain DSM 17065 / CIP 109153 / LMG 22923 / VCD115) TaxID=546414 RepID=PYRG_DEIDV|nr:CTP synthase [Deinococcus deserti]C1CWM4.1 RecName: Full=CTP synthase; AltName: Full=Cytidine 5'-triphosphate synthase; AltName: Full=Cytidine triphosphate synthetase; Short=CTP synthetase; Short=CTPS; AltName: Full=UTP--ammonia ligase [Deinococcus deserti VCD115]ACO46591.1 putative CTP synthase (UTP--ammonia ligase) (CTP synthetase) [Deinococcus deserti VCD115]
MKYIFVTGGVVSSLGKGVASASLGALLRARGYKVTAVKIDPYINIDAGTMRPYEHGEVFVTASGAETDLDIGNYERFLDLDIPAGSNITTGQVYQEVIRKERAGDYLSQTVQVIPHVTDEIKRRIRVAGETAGAEIVLIEVGGTVGDIESLPFLEAIRQFKFDEGDENVLFLHLTLVPYLGTSNEFKTKPTQHSVATLRSVGISPDIVMVRSKTKLPPEITRKIALFTSVRENRVFSSYDVGHVYEVPLALEEQGLGKVVEDLLGLERTMPNLGVWTNAVRTIKQPTREVTIAIAGKYTEMPDAYLSLMESLTHAGIANDARVNIRWVNAEELTESGEGGLATQLGNADGILVPGGFGIRGIEGKIKAAEYARTRGVPYLGICLGMQIAVIEYARHVAGLEGANSAEFDEYAPHKVIDLMPEQLEVGGKGGTMRLGDWPMDLRGGTTIAELYGVPQGGTVKERHRHRYEVNPAYTEQLQDAGLTISGVTPGVAGRGAGLVESVEIAGHPFFVALQAHPEFKSRPMRPSPPFAGFVKAALRGQSSDEQGTEATTASV